MKTVILTLASCFSFFSSLAYASSLDCKGHAWLTNAFAPNPVYREIHVQLDLAKKEATFDAGGDPMTYTGVLDLSGKQTQKIVSADSGDIITFRLEMRKKSKLRFQMNFTDSNGKSQGQLHPTTLKCQ